MREAVIKEQGIPGLEHRPSERYPRRRDEHVVVGQRPLEVGLGAAALEEMVEASRHDVEPGGIHATSGKSDPAVEGAHVVACGISNYDSHDLGKIAGVRSERIAEVLGYAFGDEAIHRNNLVVLSE